MQFRKKPVVIDATQWHKNGDHPAVRAIAPSDDLYFTGIGGATLTDREKYGVIGTLESPNHLVSPGDWIITGVKGEHYPCKPDIFAATYEPVEPPASTVPTGDIAERVTRIVAEQLCVDIAEVKVESSFEGNLGADSLDTVELILELEDEFDIEIPDEQAANIKTVQQAIDYITNSASKAVPA